MRHPLRSFAASAIAMTLLAGPCATLSAEAQTTASSGVTITGNVVDQQSGLPLSNATITLYRGSTRVASAHTDANGVFQFTSEPAGVYDLDIAAEGYQRSHLSEEAVAAGSGTVQINLVLPRVASHNGTSIREIGHISARSSRNALATTTVISHDVSPDIVQQEGKLRIGDALLGQPGLTSFNLDSAPGDDLNISIRGMRPSEAQALIDGHPVGPIGVFAGNNGGYNYQLSPSFALNDIQITYGTGATSLLGIDAIAGSIDFRTLAPTSQPHYEFTQGFGTQGIQKSVAKTTGTIGRLGYAFASGVQGTYGGFKPQVISQTGLLGGDATSANLAANTWLVSGNYVLRNDLAKLRYEFSPSTSLTATAYIGTSWDDKTGEGDNDFLTPEFALYAAQQGAPTCTLPGGGTGYVGKTNANPATCFTPQQYAATFSGPAGGTPLARQTLTLQDYSARLNTTLGKNNFSVEGFANKFDQVYNRNNAGFTNQYWTIGERISDDLVGPANDFGVGYFGVHQLYTSGTYGSSGVSFKPDLGSYVGTAFLRDVLTITPKVQLFTNVNATTSSVSNATSLDPRLSIVFRPTGSDVYRASFGRATEAPNASLKFGTLNITTQPGAINPSTGLIPIGTDANPNLQAESAKDFELSYGHRFHGDSQIQIVGYDEEVNNAIFSTTLPITNFPGAIPPNIGDYLARIATFCNCTPTAARNIGLTAFANAGHGRFRGIDITGRYRATRRLAFDYGYDLISARLFDVPTNVLQSAWTLIPGRQLPSVPFSKANLSADYTTNGGTEVHLDGYYIGRNNALLRPPFAYADGFVTHRFHDGLEFTVGVTNIFNSAYDQYGRQGYAQFLPENQYGQDANAIQQQYNGTCYGGCGERFGMPQRAITASLSFRR